MPKAPSTKRIDLGTLPTERRNPRTAKLDGLGPGALVRALQREDRAVEPAVRRALPQIAAAVAAIEFYMRQGGRLIYVGAGSSGRLGVLDAAECPPTFGTRPGLVVGVIAGGRRALTRSLEGAEDSAAGARRDLDRLKLTPADTVVGIAASGRTPYTLAALAHARRRGALTVALTANPGSPLAAAADFPIVTATGAEAVTGSTRLKAASAHKMVLNLLSTALMVRLGRVRGNLMSHMKPSNAKLRARARRIAEALR